MLRVVVAIYLMLVTAVGPAACCCTLARLTERLTPSSPSQAPKVPSCCHGGPRSEPPGKKAPSPSPRRPDSPECPCKQAGERELLALPAAHDEALESAARATIESFGFRSILPADHTVPPAWGLSVFRERPAAGPAVSTDDLLYAFHILRC